MLKIIRFDRRRRQTTMKLRSNTHGCEIKKKEKMCEKRTSFFIQQKKRKKAKNNQH